MTCKEEGSKTKPRTRLGPDRGRRLELWGGIRKLSREREKKTEKKLQEVFIKDDKKTQDGTGEEPFTSLWAKYLQPVKKQHFLFRETGGEQSGQWGKEGLRHIGGSAALSLLAETQ